MEIKGLKIAGFGKWENQTIEVNSGLQFIYGENESGKSTLFQFIRLMLFGFPRKNSKENIYQPHYTQLHGGQLLLQFPEVGMVTIERYKEQQNGNAVLLFENGDIGDEKQLQALLHPLTKELFDEVFSFQLEDLWDIHQVNENQLQHLLLTMGLSGSQKLVDIEADAKQKQKQIYKPNGKLPVLNQKLLEYQQLLKHISQKEAVEGDYIRIQQKIQQLTDQQKQLAQQKKELSKSFQRVRQQRQLWPLYEEWCQLEATIYQEGEHKLQLADVDKLLEIYQTYQFLQNQKKNWQENKDVQPYQNQSPALFFYLENERKCQDVLDHLIEVEKLSEKEQSCRDMINKKQLDKEQIIREVPELNSFEFVASKEIDIQNIALWFEEKQEFDEKMSSLNHQIEVSSLKKEEIESQLNRLEETYPELMQNEYNKKPKSFRIPGIVLMSFSLLMSAYLFLGVHSDNVFFYYLAVIVFLVGGYFFFKSPGIDLMAIKEEWQSNLNQLDTINGSLSEQEQERLDLQVKNAQLDSKWLLYVHDFGFTEEMKTMNWHRWLPFWYQIMEMEKEKAELLKELEKYQKQLDIWSEKLAFMNQWVPLADQSTLKMYHQAVQFIKKAQAQKEKHQQMNQTSPKWMEGFQDIDKQIDTLLSENQEILQRNQIKKMDDLYERYQFFQNQETQKKRIDELKLRLENEFDLTKKYKEVDLERREKELKVKWRRTEEKITQNQLQIQPLTYELNVMETDGTLAYLYQEKEEQRSEIRLLTEEWLQASLTVHLISDLLNFLSDQQLPSLLATTSYYFKHLTSGKYSKCVLEDGQLKVLHVGGRTYSISELSTGTQDQLYVSLRFAFVFLHHSECNMPLIIDDGWLHYDQKRKQAFFEILEKLSSDMQIICLSSDDEALRYFKDKQYPVFVL